MSCTNATSPIDISMSNITGNCDLKCAFSCHYVNSSCVVYNRHNYLSFTYDKAAAPPATYNAAPYDVSEVRLYVPSLHTFNGSQHVAELIVVHTSNTNANPLLVCVPVESGGSGSGSGSGDSSSAFFKQLVDTVASNAPAEDEHTTAASYDLSVLVPKKPFFSYSATEPFQPCSEQTNDFVVFTDTISMTSDTLDKLSNILTPHSYTVKSNNNNGPLLFYNAKGVGDGNGDVGSDNIYIDCQPVLTGTDAEQIDVINDKTRYNGGGSSGSSGSFDWANNTVVRIVVGSLGFICLLFFINYLLKMATPTKK